MKLYEVKCINKISKSPEFVFVIEEDEAAAAKKAIEGMTEIGSRYRDYVETVRLLADNNPMKEGSYFFIGGVTK